MSQKALTNNAGSMLRAIVVLLLALLAGAASAFHDGDFIHTAKRVQLKQVGVAGGSRGWLALLLAPPLSVTVRLTTTVPAALVASVALLALVAPLKLASAAPLTIVPW